MFSQNITLHYIMTKREAKHITTPTKPTTILEEMLVGASSAAASSPPGPGAKDGLLAGASTGDSLGSSEGEGESETSVMGSSAAEGALAFFALVGGALNTEETSTFVSASGALALDGAPEVCVSSPGNKIGFATWIMVML